MMHSHCTLLFLPPICVILIELCFVNAYAQLADTMLCADESCSETISQGEARLAYRPKDDKFLNFKKGDVVIVKSKNAGKRSQLWGGEVMGSDQFGFFPSSFIKELIVTVKSPGHSVSVQDFLNKHRSAATESSYANLVGENQKITIEKSKTHKMDAKDNDDHQDKTGRDSLGSKELEIAPVEVMVKEGTPLNQTPSSKLKGDPAVTASTTNVKQQHTSFEENLKSNDGDIPPDIAVLLGKTEKQEILGKDTGAVEIEDEINIKNSKVSSSEKIISEDVDLRKDLNPNNTAAEINISKTEKGDADLEEDGDLKASINPVDIDLDNLSSGTALNDKTEDDRDFQTPEDQGSINDDSAGLNEAQTTDYKGETVVADDGDKGQQEHSIMNNSDVQNADENQTAKENAHSTNDNESLAHARKQIDNHKKDSNVLKPTVDASDGKQENYVSSNDAVHDHHGIQTVGKNADGDANIKSEVVVETTKENEDSTEEKNRKINYIPTVTDAEGSEEHVGLKGYAVSSDNKDETLDGRNTEADVIDRKENDIKPIDREFDSPKASGVTTEGEQEHGERKHSRDSENSLASHTSEEALPSRKVTTTAKGVETKQENAVSNDDDTQNLYVNETTTESTDDDADKNGNTVPKTQNEDDLTDKKKKVDEKALNVNPTEKDADKNVNRVPKTQNGDELTNKKNDVDEEALNVNPTEKDADKNVNRVSKTQNEDDLSDKKENVDEKALNVNPTDKDADKNVNRVLKTQNEDELTDKKNEVDEKALNVNSTEKGADKNVNRVPKTQNEDELTDKKNEVDEKALNVNLAEKDAEKNVNKVSKTQNEDELTDKKTEVDEKALNVNPTEKDPDKNVNKVSKTQNEDVLTNKKHEVDEKALNVNPTEKDADENVNMVSKPQNEEDLPAKKIVVNGITLNVKESTDGGENEEQDQDRHLTLEENAYVNEESQAAIEIKIKDKKELPNQETELRSKIKTADDKDVLKQKEVLKRENENNMEGEDLSAAKMTVHQSQDDEIISSKSDSISSTEADENKNSYAKPEEIAESSVDYNTSDSEDPTKEHSSEASGNKEKNSKSLDGGIGATPEFDSTTAVQMLNIKDSKVAENDVGADSNRKDIDNVNVNTAKETTVILKDGLHDGFGMCNYGDDKLLKWFCGVNLNHDLSATSSGNTHLDKKKKLNALNRITPNSELDSTFHRVMSSDLTLSSPKIGSSQIEYSDLSLDPLLKWFFPHVLYSDSTKCKEEICLRTSDEKYEEPASKKAVGEHYSDLKSDPMLKWLFLPSVSNIGSKYMQNNRSNVAIHPTNDLLQWFLTYKAVDTTPSLKFKTLDSYVKPQKQDNVPLLLNGGKGHSLLFDDPLLRYFIQHNTDVTLPLKQDTEPSVEDLEFKTFDDSMKGFFEQYSDKHSKGYSNLAADPLLRWLLAHPSRAHQCIYKSENNMKKEDRKIQMQGFSGQYSDKHNKGYSDLAADPILRWLLARPSSSHSYIGKREMIMRKKDQKIQMQGFPEQYSGKHSKGYSDLAADPLLRWLLAYPPSAHQRIDKEEMNMKKNHQKIDEEEHYTNLLKDPLLQWFIRGFCASHEHSSTINCYKQNFPQSTGKPFSDLNNDPILRWFVHKEKGDRKIQILFSEQYSDMHSKGYSHLAADPLLRWLLAHPSSAHQCIDKEEMNMKKKDQNIQMHGFSEQYSDKHSKRYSHLAADPLLRWLLAHPPSAHQCIDKEEMNMKQNDQKIQMQGFFEQCSDKHNKGYSHLAADPLLRWLLAHPSIAHQCIDKRKRKDPKIQMQRFSEQYSDKHSKGYPHLAADPLLRRLLAHPPSAHQCIDKEEMNMKQNDQKIQMQEFFEQYSDKHSKGYSHLAADPLLRWLLAHPLRAHQCIDKREKKDQKIQMQGFPEQYSGKHSKGYSDLAADPLLRWLLAHPSSARQCIDKEKMYMKQNNQKIDEEEHYTNLLKDPLLQWFIRGFCVSHDEANWSKIHSEFYNRNGMTDLMRDPMLKWFISVPENPTAPIIEVLKIQGKNYSARTQNPLIFYYNTRQSSHPASNYQSVSPDYDMNYGIFDYDNCNCAFVYNNPLIEKTVVLGKRDKMQELNEADHVFEYKSTPAHGNIARSVPTVNNLVEWFFPKFCASKASKDSTRDDTEHEIQYLQLEGQTKQSVLLDYPLLKWFYHVKPEKSDISFEVNGINNRQFSDAQKDFDNVESHVDSIDFNIDTHLRSQIKEFKKAYEHVSSFRTVVTDTMDIINMLRKNKPSVLKKYHNPGKIMRKQVISLEEDILQQLKILTDALHISNVQKVVDITEDFFLEKSKTLKTTSSKIVSLEKDIHSLREAVSDELYPNLEMDEEDEMAQSNRDIAETELENLHEKLLYLDERVLKKTTESEQVILKLTDEAEKFKLRIAGLESVIALKNKEGEIQKINFEVSERKISEKLADIEALIGRTQTEEQANTALKETLQMKKQLELMKSYIKETEAAGKPYHNRISHLEKELHIHRAREMEKARKYKYNAAKLHIKIQSLENQLETNDGNKLLEETSEVQEKLKILENELSMKADKGKKTKEVELEERLNSLEKEVEKQFQGNNSLSKEKDVNDLHSRLAVMEAKLNSKIGKDSKAQQDDNKIAQHSHTKNVKVQSHLSQREILSFLDSLFLGTPAAGANEYRNQSKTIIKADSEFLTDGHNDTKVDSKCIIKSAKRMACGSKVLSEKFCKALQCCWYPVPDDLSIPPCYFSLLQMTDETNLNDRSPSKLETLSPDDGNFEESYELLHEGKVVEWDESLQSTKKKSRTMVWDEIIGKTDENVNPSKFDAVTTTVETDTVENDKQLATKNDVNSTTSAAANTVKDNELLNTNDTDDIGDNKGGDEQSSMSTDSGEKEKDSVSRKSEISDAVETVEKIIEDERSTISLGENSEKIDTTAVYEMKTNTQEPFIGESRPEVQEIMESDVESPQSDTEMHVESLPLRILLQLSRFPNDIQYVTEPIFKLWVSLLPEEYQNDVHGVSWAVICCTMFIGCLFLWIFLWRMKSISRKRKEAKADDTVKELRLQLEAVIEEKLEKENKLKAKQTEMESKREELDSAYQNNNLLTTEKSNMQSSFTEFRSQYEQLRHTFENLTGELDQKNSYIGELLDKYQSLEKAQDIQQQLLSDHEKSLSKLDNLVKDTEESKRGMEITINKQKEKIKALEKAKGDTKKEGKTWKDQAGKLNERIGQLEESLNVEVTENEQSKQEIDVLKDCLLQLRGVQEALGSDEDGEVSVEKQKLELKALIDVHEIKKVLKQTESQKTQLTYELEAERKSRKNTEAKISELEGEIQCNDAMKNKLEHDKQMLDSKLTVMQEFYARREVEIQSKLGKEQTKLESNSFLLEERQQQEIELVKQLEIYKKMNEDSKRQYEDSERKHKQEIVAFEKKAHENWLACREAERKHDEGFKQINQLHMELADLQHRLHIEREPIIRPRPERHGPPGAPPPFGPPRRGIPPSPVHFRSGPPEISRRSPMIPRRPPSPVNSLNEDQMRSHSPTGRPRPDRPPSAQSLPPGDRRPPSHGPFIPPASHGPAGRSFGPYREGIPPQLRPLLHRPPYSYPRGPPDSRTRDPTFPSPYMDRPTIPPSISPGHLPDFSNNTQGSLHAPPPIIRGSDRGDRPPSMSYSTPTNVGPPLYDNKPGMVGPNPFRRV